LLHYNHSEFCIFMLIFCFTSVENLIEGFALYETVYV